MAAETFEETLRRLDAACFGKTKIRSCFATEHGWLTLTPEVRRNTNYIRRRMRVRRDKAFSLYAEALVECGMEVE